ncbi:MAG TPA: ABC transporter permease subunit [Coriobacteriia bacterium]|jgi:ABC-2 type transport system permease protein
MLRDAWLIVMKEYREVLLRMGSLKGTIFNLALIVGLFGVFMPLQAGMTWVTEPLMPLLYAWLPLFLVSALVADSFAGERERHTLETLLTTALSDGAILLGKLAAAVLYGYVMLLAVMVLGIVTVNTASRTWGHPVFYRADVAVAVVVLGFLVTLLIGAIGVLVSLKAPTVRQAGQALSLGILTATAGPGFAVLYGYRLLPVEWQEGMAVWMLAPGNGHALAAIVGLLLAAANVVILAFASRRFKRARLAFD